MNNFNETEVELLRQRVKQHQFTIKKNHRLPKKERNEIELRKALIAVNKIQKWLKNQ